MELVKNTNIVDGNEKSRVISTRSYFKTIMIAGLPFYAGVRLFFTPATNHLFDLIPGLTGAIQADESAVSWK
jgi:hypothetical protein